MKSPFVKFLYPLIFISIICVAEQLIWNWQMPEYLQLEQGLLLLSIFIVSVSGFHYFLLRTAHGSPSAFVRGYMVSMVLKFFFYVLLLAAFLVLFKTHQKAFVLHFVLYYTVFTALEVTMIYKEMMKKK